MKDNYSRFRRKRRLRSVQQKKNDGIPKPPLRPAANKQPKLQKKKKTIYTPEQLEQLAVKPKFFSPPKLETKTATRVQKENSSSENPFYMMLSEGTRSRKVAVPLKRGKTADNREQAARTDDNITPTPDTKESLVQEFSSVLEGNSYSVDDKDEMIRNEQPKQSERIATYDKELLVDEFSDSLTASSDEKVEVDSTKDTAEEFESELEGADVPGADDMLVKKRILSPEKAADDEISGEEQQQPESESEQQLAFIDDDEMVEEASLMHKFSLLLSEAVSEKEKNIDKAEEKNRKTESEHENRAEQFEESIVEKNKTEAEHAVCYPSVVAKLPVLLARITVDIDIVESLARFAPQANIVKVNLYIYSLQTHILPPTSTLFLKGQFIADIEYAKENESMAMHSIQLPIDWKKTITIDWRNKPDLPEQYDKEYQFASDGHNEISSFHHESFQKYAAPIVHQARNVYFIWHYEQNSRNIDLQGSAKLVLDFYQPQYICMPIMDIEEKRVT